MKQEYQDLDISLCEGAHQVSDEVIEECLGQRLEEEEVHEAIHQVFNPVLRLIFVVDL